MRVGTAYYLAPELAAAALENYAKKGVKINNKIPAATPRTGKILKAADGIYTHTHSHTHKHTDNVHNK